MEGVDKAVDTFNVAFEKKSILHFKHAFAVAGTWK